MINHGWNVSSGENLTIWGAKLSVVGWGNRLVGRRLFILLLEVIGLYHHFEAKLALTSRVKENSSEWVSSWQASIPSDGNDWLYLLLVTNSTLDTQVFLLSLLSIRCLRAFALADLSILSLDFPAFLQFFPQMSFLKVLFLYLKLEAFFPQMLSISLSCIF